MPTFLSGGGGGHGLRNTHHLFFVNSLSDILCEVPPAQKSPSSFLALHLTGFLPSFLALPPSQFPISLSPSLYLSSPLLSSPPLPFFVMSSSLYARTHARTHVGPPGRNRAGRIVWPPPATRPAPARQSTRPPRPGQAGAQRPSPPPPTRPVEGREEREEGRRRPIGLTQEKWRKRERTK